ncbi:MAG: hypothetical protein NT175_07895 [Bacteroidetes bacterium]|nr:hypothetical protein [Bacteroidota bacterium]
MDNLIILQIDTPTIVAICALVIVILGGGYKLFEKIGGIGQKTIDIKEDIGRIDNTIDGIHTDIKEIRESIQPLMPIKDSVFAILMSRFSTSQSPRKLNEMGLKVFKDSKIGEIVAPYIEEITQKVKLASPPNAYVAESLLIEEFSNLRNKEEIKNKIEQAAFLTGQEVSIILLIAALYFRDKIFESLDLKIEDIDTFSPKKSE